MIKLRDSKNNEKFYIVFNNSRSFYEYYSMIRTWISFSDFYTNIIKILETEEFDMLVIYKNGIIGKGKKEGFVKEDGTQKVIWDEFMVLYRRYKLNEMKRRKNND